MNSLPGTPSPSTETDTSPEPEPKAKPRTERVLGPDPGYEAGLTKEEVEEAIYVLYSPCRFTLIADLKNHWGEELTRDLSSIKADSRGPLWRALVKLGTLRVQTIIDTGKTYMKDLEKEAAGNAAQNNG